MRSQSAKKIATLLANKLAAYGANRELKNVWRPLIGGRGTVTAAQNARLRKRASHRDARNSLPSRRHASSREPVLGCHPTTRTHTRHREQSLTKMSRFGRRVFFFFYSLLPRIFPFRGGAENIFGGRFAAKAPSASAVTGAGREHGRSYLRSAPAPAEAASTAASTDYRTKTADRL